jgi:translation initiation factor 2B subunit (eIF-2B alpha/beta/delta family)
MTVVQLAELNEKKQELERFAEWFINHIQDDNTIFAFNYSSVVDEYIKQNQGKKV